MGIIIIRICVVGLITGAGYFFPPFQLEQIYGGGVGLALSLLFLWVEWSIRKSQFKIIWSAMLSSLIGLFIGWLLGAMVPTISNDGGTTAFFRFFFIIIMPAIGFLVGVNKFEWLDPSFLVRFFKERSVGRSYKVVDTSVIIDGRIADICDTAFIEGTLIVPQFILKELQLVADSSDAIKRQRGRRGLDVLDHLQKSSQVSVMISEMDFPEVNDVDSKLIEFAKYHDAKIVTNDFNLNKVAQLQGLTVLNINELANALKPVVLPGETIQAFILKEGKEKDQGIAYLDDGTMVVVDNSRRKIGQTIDITVTSVLQTTVGKMIFGRYNDEG